MIVSLLLIILLNCFFTQTCSTFYIQIGSSCIHDQAIFISKFSFLWWFDAFITFALWIAPVRTCKWTHHLAWHFCIHLKSFQINTTSTFSQLKFLSILANINARDLIRIIIFILITVWFRNLIWALFLTSLITTVLLHLLPIIY